MTAWTSEELHKIDISDELHLRSERADGSLREPVTIWVVRHSDEVYVRPVRGTDGWHRGARTRHRGRVVCAGVDRDVTFVEAGADPELNRKIDDAYRSKYSGYPATIVGHVTNDVARSATLRLDPRP